MWKTQGNHRFFIKNAIMKGMKYHDYIWDLGGTLLDNYETSTAAFVETLALYGITQDHDSVYQSLKVSTDLRLRHSLPT